MSNNGLVPSDGPVDMITAVDDCGLCQFAEVIIPPGSGDPAGTEPRTTFVVDVAGYSALLNNGTILKRCAGDIVTVTGRMVEYRRISPEAQAILDTVNQMRAEGTGVIH